MTDVKTLASGGAIPVALLMSSSAVFVEVALSCLELYIICRSVFTIPGLPVDKKREGKRLRVFPLLSGLKF